MKFNNLGHCMKGAGLTTAASIKSKVVSNPVRSPINKQALRIMAPAGWLEKPLPPEEDLSNKETVLQLSARLAETQALLFKEREENGNQGRLIANLRVQVRAKNEGLVLAHKSLQQKDQQLSQVVDQMAYLRREYNALKGLVGI